jgi:hypothetical protein
MGSVKVKGMVLSGHPIQLSAAVAFSNKVYVPLGHMVHRSILLSETLYWPTLQEAQTPDIYSKPALQ